MKHTRIFVALLVVVTFFSACAPPQTADDKRREQQNKILQEGVAKVGLPGIVNFREAKVMRMIQELCDQEIITYTYMENMIPTVVHGHTALGGKLTFVSETISYPIPYATQFTAPETMQTYNISRSDAGSGNNRYGVARLPQADPNGLFKPASAEGSWVLMKDPKSDKVAPVYVEPRLVTLPFKLPMD